MHNPGRVIENSKGKEVSKAKILKGNMNLYKKFLRGGVGGSKLKKKNWGVYEYFLEKRTDLACEQKSCFLIITCSC